jgi:hypothetical protein
MKPRTHEREPEQPKPPEKSGAEATAVQTLRAGRMSLKIRGAFGLRRLTAAFERHACPKIID